MVKNCLPFVHTLCCQCQLEVQYDNFMVRNIGTCYIKGVHGGGGARWAGGGGLQYPKNPP